MLAEKSTFERWRVPLTITIAPVWVLALVLMRPDGFNSLGYQGLKLAGFLLVFAAVLGRLWCSLYISGRKDKELCREGPYALSRNPLYFFSFLAAVGLPLAAQNPILALASASVFLLFYRMVIEREEARLSRVFGPAFADYVERVPRFFPRLAVGRRPKTLGVSVRTFERSLTEVAWFLIALAGLELLEIFKGTAGFSAWSTPY